MEKEKPEKQWRITGEGVFCPLCGAKAKPISSQTTQVGPTRDNPDNGVQITVLYRCDCDTEQQK